MTEQNPWAQGQQPPTQWGAPTPYQRPEPDATAQQPGTEYDAWGRPVTGATPGPGYQQYPQPTAYDQQSGNSPQYGQPAPGGPQYAPPSQGGSPYGQTSYDGQYAQPGPPYGQPTVSPAYGQPSSGAPQYGQPYHGDGTAPAYDPMTGYGQLGPAEPVSKPRGRRRTLLVSAGAVVVLLLGVGAFAAVRIWTGSGNTEPESAMPASVGAFARADFNPGVRDKLAIDNLIKKFPSHGESSSDLLTQLEQGAAQALDLSYSADVAPWFDGRVGVAEWTNHSGAPVALLDLASKNDTAATAALTKVQASKGADSFGFVVQNGFALIAIGDSGAQADAVSAAADAKGESLASSSAYKSAYGALDGNNLIVAYVDLHEIGALVGKELSGSDTGLGGAGNLGILGGMFGSGGSASTNALSQLSGSFIVGVSIVDDGVEVRMHVESPSAATGATGTTNVRPTLDALPDSTIVGLALDGLDPNGATAKSLTALLGTAIGGQLGGGSSDESDALVQAATTLLTSKVLTLALTGLTSDGPSVLIGADTRDTAGATSLKSTIDQLLGSADVPGLKVTQSGTRIQATIGQTGSGHLGDNALYKETMSGMSNIHEGLYLDVQKLVTAVGGMSPTDRTDIAPLKAIGLSGTSSGSTADVLIRVIIK